MAPKRAACEFDSSSIPSCRVGSSCCISSHMVNSTHADSCCLSSLYSKPVKVITRKPKVKPKTKSIRKPRRRRTNILKDSSGWRSKVGCGRLHYSMRSHKAPKSVLKKKKSAAKKKNGTGNKLSQKTTPVKSVSNSMALMPPPPLPVKAGKNTAEIQAEKTDTPSSSNSPVTRSQTKCKQENRTESRNMTKSPKNVTSSQKRTEGSTLEQSNTGLHLCDSCTANLSSVVASLQISGTGNSSNIFKIAKLQNTPQSYRLPDRVSNLNKHLEEIEQRMEAETAETDRDVSDCEFQFPIPSLPQTDTKLPLIQRPVTRTDHKNNLKLSQASQCSPASITAAQNPQHNIVTPRHPHNVIRPAASALTQTPTYFTAFQENKNPAASSRHKTSCCSDIYVVALPPTHPWPGSNLNLALQTQKIMKQERKEANLRRTQRQGGDKSSSSSSSSRPSRQSAIIARAKISKIYEPRRRKTVIKHKL